MSDNVSSRNRLRKAVRTQEAAVSDDRVWKWMSRAAAAWSAGLVFLWVMTIQWAVASIGVRDLGFTPVVVFLGLIVLSVITGAGVAGAFAMRFETRKALAKAKWEYEDAVLDDGGML